MGRVDMLVAVCADKGSPGATTTAFVLAATWPVPAMLVEFDPSGGDLAVRARHESGGQVAPTPNVLGLTAAVRAGSPEPAMVASHTQPLRCGVQVVPGVLVAEQAAGMRQLWPALADACLSSEGDVIADLGRIHAASPTVPVAAAADAVVVVGSASLEGVLHLRERLTHLLPAIAQSGSGRRPRVVPVLVCADRHASAVVGETGQVLSAAGLSIDDVGCVTYDPRALARLLDGEPATGRLARSLLLRSARALAAGLHQAHRTVEVLS